MADARLLVAENATEAIVGDELATDAWEAKYPYGWREQRTKLPNGKWGWQRIPLTLHDALHPQEDDVLMPNHEHEQLRTYLTNVIMAQVVDDPTAVVLSDTNVKWDVIEIAPHRPDLALIFGVRKKQNWGTFDVTEENTRPTLIIEITSPKTRHLDFEEKYLQYEQVGVPFYTIIDLKRSKLKVERSLYGYRLTPEGYIPTPLNERGWLWLEPIGVWLAVVNQTIACYDKDGNLIQEYAALAKAKRAADKRAATERVRARAAEVRANQEARARAEEAQARAEEAQARAAAEARAAALEERIRQLEALQRQSNGDNRQ
jgi:Uma2 family endonuclease